MNAGQHRRRVGSVRPSHLMFTSGVGALVAATIITLFEGTISKMVALAALMPIVAGVGGNAGTQTLAAMERSQVAR